MSRKRYCWELLVSIHSSHWDRDNLPVGLARSNGADSENSQREHGNSGDREELHDCRLSWLVGLVDEDVCVWEWMLELISNSRKQIVVVLKNSRRALS